MLQIAFGGSGYISAKIEILTFFSGFAYGIDGKKISIEDEICASFDGRNCKALHGKPKIFIIQACQGGNVPYNERAV